MTPVESYLEHYGQILLTNYRKFALWTWENGRPTPGERFFITENECAFWDITHRARDHPLHGEALKDFYVRYFRMAERRIVDGTLAQKVPGRVASRPPVRASCPNGLSLRGSHPLRTPAHRRQIARHYQARPPHRHSPRAPSRARRALSSHRGDAGRPTFSCEGQDPEPPTADNHLNYDTNPANPKSHSGWLAACETTPHGGWRRSARHAFPTSQA